MENRIYDAFSSVKASEAQKKQVLQTLAKKRTRLANRGRRLFQAIPAVAALLVLLLSGSLYGVAQQPAAYVSIDVNPSLELTLNRKNRVIRADAYNGDGAAVLDAVSVRGLDFEDAIAAIVTSDAMRPYLEKGAKLTFTVATGDSDRETLLLETIRSCGNACGQDVACYQADTNCIGEAHANGFSLGKYAAYLLLSDYDDAVTVDDCREKSVSEIHRLVQEHETHSGKEHHEDSPSHADDQENDSPSHANDPENSMHPYDSPTPQPGATDAPHGNGHGQHRNEHGRH